MTEEERYKAQTLGVIDTIMDSINKLDLHCTNHIITMDQLTDFKGVLSDWSTAIKEELDKKV